MHCHQLERLRLSAEAYHLNQSAIKDAGVHGDLAGRPAPTCLRVLYYNSQRTCIDNE